MAGGGSGPMTHRSWERTSIYWIGTVVRSLGPEPFDVYSGVSDSGATRTSTSREGVRSQMTRVEAGRSPVPKVSGPRRRLWSRTPRDTEVGASTVPLLLDWRVPSAGVPALPLWDTPRRTHCTSHGSPSGLEFRPKTGVARYTRVGPMRVWTRPQRSRHPGPTAPLLS